MKNYTVFMIFIGCAVDVGRGKRVLFSYGIMNFFRRIRRDHYPWSCKIIQKVMVGSISRNVHTSAANVVKYIIVIDW